jgi:hypothetical protein
LNETKDEPKGTSMSTSEHDIKKRMYPLTPAVVDELERLQRGKTPGMWGGCSGDDAALKELLYRHSEALIEAARASLPAAATAAGGGYTGYGCLNDILNTLSELRDKARLRADDLLRDEVSRAKSEGAADTYAAAIQFLITFQRIGKLPFAGGDGDGRSALERARAVADALRDLPDRVQGFSYGPAPEHGPPHVVRDVHRPSGEQELWRGDDRDEMLRRCETERMRLALEQAGV